MGPTYIGDLSSLKFARKAFPNSILAFLKSKYVNVTGFLFIVSTPHCLVAKEVSFEPIGSINERPKPTTEAAPEPFFATI